VTAPQPPPHHPDHVSVLAFGLDDVEADLDCLSETERHRADELFTATLTHRYRAARSMLRHALAQSLQRPAAELSIEVDQHGKPWLPEHPELHFNVSHSAGQGLIGLGPCQLGVDVEATTSRHCDNDELARWVLEPAALDAWLGMDAPQRAELLCRAWTFKEALVKARGTGLGEIGFSTVVVPAGGCGPIAAGADGESAWWVQELPAPWGFHAALCTRGPPPAVDCLRLEAGHWGRLPLPG
jgi:4'-phosphopantetheinyl transferase